jgi:threonine dehydrogenase-like Zn-dependent dehydrogenase
MAIPRKRKIAAVCGDGHIRLVEQDVPDLKPGAVLVEVHASLVSPGTELNGWHALRARRDAPSKDAKPRPFGYANAGVVLKVGKGVKDLKRGQRVCCIGGGYAQHTDYAVVPHNLAVPMPDSVSFAQGSYGHLAATAVHALRRGQAEFGEWACVVGLGLIGQLTAQVYCLAGNFVIGWERLALRREIARRCGIDATATVGEDDLVAVTRQFTCGEGLDAALIAFGGDATESILALEKAMKVSPDGHPMGRIVIIGAARFPYTDTLTNMDIRRSSRPGAGYHDEAWEYGPDYPPVFMRWTTRTNLALALRLMAAGRLKVDELTTHTIPLDEVDQGISAALDDPDGILGVVFVPSHP